MHGSGDSWVVRLRFAGVCPCADTRCVSLVVARKFLCAGSSSSGIEGSGAIGGTPSVAGICGTTITACVRFSAVHVLIRGSRDWIKGNSVIDSPLGIVGLDGPVCAPRSCWGFCRGCMVRGEYLGLGAVREDWIPLDCMLHWRGI